MHKIRQFLFIFASCLTLILATAILILSIPSTISISSRLPSAVLLWINNVSLVASVSFSLIVGAFADRFDNRKLLASLLGITLVSLLCYSFEKDSQVLIVLGRILSTTIFGTYPILYRNIFGILPKDRSVTRGVLSLSTLVANISSPVALYGFLTIGYLERDRLYNFDSLYKVLSIATFALLLLTLLSKPILKPMKTELHSYYPVFIYALSFICCAYGIRESESFTHIAGYPLYYIVLGLATCVFTMFFDKLSNIGSVIAKGTIPIKRLIASNLLIILIGIVMQIYVVALNLVFLDNTDKFHYLSRNVHISVITVIISIQLLSFVAPMLTSSLKSSRKIKNDNSDLTAKLFHKFSNYSIISLLGFSLLIYLRYHYVGVASKNILMRIVIIASVCIGIYYMQSLIPIILLYENVKNNSLGVISGMAVSSQGLGNIIGFALLIEPFLNKYIQEIIISVLGNNIAVGSYTHLSYSFYNLLILVSIVLYVILIFIYRKTLHLGYKTVSN